MKRPAFALLASGAALVCSATSALGDVTMPGFSVQVYAHVPAPMRLSFGSDGALYVGNAGDPAKIHRVAPGGTEVVEYGESALRDPDAVLFDAAGTISGTAGSVLVGGSWREGDILCGQISAILPEESVIALFGPSTEFFNINDLEFGETGRLFAADAGYGNVLVSDGGPLQVFATLPTAAQSLAVDSADRVFVSGYDGVIRMYDAAGNLVDSAFATGLSLRPELHFGTGGAFGEDLYVLDNGTLLRLDASGTAVGIGAGFDVPVGGGDLTFGPDGALYVSETPSDRILRITPIPEPRTPLLLAVCCVSMLLWQRRRREPGRPA